MDPPELPVAQLVRLTGLFGISENRARVALSRMVASGEATSDGSGRYRLAGHLAARQSRQSASRAGATAPYDGEWWLAVVTTTGSSADVRGSPAPGPGLRPVGRAARRRVDAPGQPGLPVARSAGRRRRAHDGAARRTPTALAHRLWDLPAWSARARLLLERLQALDPDGPDALAPGFELSAAVLRHLQADPLLPAALLPARLARRAAARRPTTSGTPATGRRCGTGAGPPPEWMVIGLRGGAN